MLNSLPNSSCYTRAQPPGIPVFSWNWLPPLWSSNGDSLIFIEASHDSIVVPTVVYALIPLPYRIYHDIIIKLLQWLSLLHSGSPVNYRSLVGVFTIWYVDYRASLSVADNRVSQECHQVTSCALASIRSL